MAILGDTGQAATFTLSVQGLSLSITSIEIGEDTIDMLDASLLATTDRMLRIASDLKNHLDVTVNFIWATLLDGVSVGGSVETGTVTFPLRTGEATAANLAGTGIVRSLQRPSFQLGTIQTGSLIFGYDGDTGPTYTKAVAA